MIQSNEHTISYVETIHPFSFKRFKQHFVLGRWGKVFVAICFCLILYRVIDIFPKLGTWTYMSMIIFPLLIELLGYYLTETKRDQQKEEE
jgi:cytochrome bd-type quinol oxidase subunit 1